MKRSTMLAALVPLVLLPTCAVVHELGHLSVAKAYGYRTQLLPAKAIYFYSNEPGANRRLAFLIAGPVVDVLQVATGLTILLCMRMHEDKQRKLIYWVAMVFASISMKWVATPLGAYFVRSNDEAQISALLGWHRMSLPFVVMLLGIPIMVYIVRQHLKQGSFMQLAIAPSFGILGGGIWVKVLGPMLLN